MLADEGGFMNTSDNYSIRYARSSDLTPMTRLLDQLFSIEEDFLADPAKQQAGLTLLLESENGQIFIVEDRAGKVVAMASLQIVVSTAQGGFAAWVEDVVVDAAHRGRGIGEGLLTHIHAWAQARQITRLQLVADCNNRPALDFYQKNGWFETNLTVLRYV
jgi:ribosomal protein S18 acetylase RimI-like enzyme